MHNRYTASADIYDVIYDEMLDYGALAGRIDELIRSRNAEALTLLEVACGTGLYLEQLQGPYRVEGSDLSEKMLDVAAARLSDVPLHHADMTLMSLGSRYDVVLCVGSSVAYLARAGDLADAYSRFADHVAPGGIVIVEPWLQPHTWIDGHVGIDIHERRGIKVVRMTSGERSGKSATMHMHHLVSEPGKAIEYFVEEHPTGLFTVDDHLATFASAGLTAEWLPDEGGLGRGLYVAVASAHPVEPADHA